MIMSTSMSATWSFSLTRRICCRMRSYYHTNIYWSKRGSPAWAIEQPAMSVIAERSVRSQQAVRLLGVSRDPGRHALIVGVGVSVAEVRGSLFGYPPKKLYGFGKRALDVCLVVVSECLMEFAEDTGVGPRLQETPLVPGVVTGPVSGACHVSIRKSCCF